nr:uncharacterized protein LOC113743929 [Coffea arabica]
MRFEKSGKLRPRYIGLFEILERVGNLAYRLALLLALSKVHNVFHMSQLRKYVFDPSYVLKAQPLEVREDTSYREHLVKIVNQKDQVLRRRMISHVKFQRTNHIEREATWELEEKMRAKYPQLFTQVQQGRYVLLTEQVDAHPNILTFYVEDKYVYEFVEADGD